MSYTLLDYTQTILSSMDSDEVNSIDDTVESLQVVKCIRTAYEEIVARADLNEHYDLFKLTASGDNAKPTLMTRPSDVYSMLWLKYNIEDTDDTDDKFTTLTFLPLDKFLEHIHQYDESESNVGSFTYGDDSIKWFFIDDKAPEYWTTYNDSVIIFDSHDAVVDTTLQASKTLAYGKKEQTWTESDAFVPFIDNEFSVLLLNEAKSLAFMELKQVGHQKAEVSARRLWSESQKKKRSLDRDKDELSRAPNYGRK